MLFVELDRTLGNFASTVLDQTSTRGGVSVLSDARLDDRGATSARLKIDQQITDNEVILEAYLQWGANCAAHLIGDFVFVVIDRPNGKIVCSRDHIGARPLFYSLDGDRLCIASDIGSLLENRPDLSAIDHSFAATALVDSTFTSSDRTFLHRVRKLPPGHTLTVDVRSHDLDRFWHPRDVPPLNLGSDGDYVEAARDVLEIAVNDRLIRAKRPAVHLSGGLDSSAVAALTTGFQRRASRPDPIGFAWHYRPADTVMDQETGWTEAARVALGLEIDAYELSADDVLSALRADWCTGPNRFNLLYEGAILRQAEAGGIDTILSGWGGDESLSFNGRGYSAELLFSAKLLELAEITGGPLPTGLLRGIKRGFSDYFRNGSDARSDKTLQSSYLRKDVTQEITLLPSHLTSLRSTKDAMTSLIETGGLTARLEDWANAGHQHNIDYSYPLLDRRVMEFALSLPGHLFSKAGTRRWIMRKVLDPKMPDLIRHNSIKAEPARVEHLKDMMYGALRKCADMLEDGGNFGERADLVDIERLTADLRGPKDTVMKNLSHKRRALQFLKF